MTLALENNYDIAIARINLDIADTDILRAKAGSTLARRFDRAGDGDAGRDRRRRSRAAAARAERRARRAAGTGASGLVLSTNGGGPLPENLDPVLTGTLEYERATTPAVEHAFSRTIDSTEHVDVQLRLSAGIHDGHAA